MEEKSSLALLLVLPLRLAVLLLAMDESVANDCMSMQQGLSTTTE
jgi:hypothetical protein